MNIYSSVLYKECISYLLIFLILIQAFGCRYFEVNQVSPANVPRINDIGKMHKYFVLHSGETTYALTNISVDSNYLSGYLKIARDKIYYNRDSDDPYENYRYKKTENTILNEVHIYMRGGVEKPQMGANKIPLVDIKAIEVIDHNSKKTNASYVFGTFAVVVGVLAVIGIIVALTKSSCPYIYSYDGEGFGFEGEIYGGAIGENLIRDDYMPLKAIEADGENYRIRISNELKENQFTDLAQLIVVNHLPSQKVLLDKYGEPQLVSSHESPIMAHSFSGADLFPAIHHKDKKVFLFNDMAHSQNGMILTFHKPVDIAVGKLILNGKNTLWFDYLFGEFIKKFGSRYENWMEKQSKISSKERIENILDCEFPLSVYVRNAGDWQLVDYLFTVGPLANRDLVIPIDMTQVVEDVVEIKLETGFMFWEFDYAAMDYSENIELEINYLKPSFALGTGSIDWTSTLKEADGNYMIQEKTGEVTEVIFKGTPPIDDHIQTIFLHTRGYYELIRDFEGMPELIELNKFKEPGYFSDFSRISYLKFLDMEEQIASVIKVK